MRKIAVITGTRADYGLLYWMIRGIQEDDDLELQLIVTGMHLSPEFGLTVREIEGDGFPVAERVEMLLSSDTEYAISASMAIGMAGCAKAYDRLRPDIIVILGDRFESLSAAAAAVPFRIPVAHIHGGESTEGAMDEQIRHAITKLSHVHFTSTEKYRMRVVQMGEAGNRVFNFGAPGLENIRRLRLLDKDELASDLGLPANRRLGIVTFHPATLDPHSAGKQVSELLSALIRFDSVFWVLTMPNADTGGRVIMDMFREFEAENPGFARCFSSLGRLKYLSAMRHASVMAGNSSSALIEAPSFELPAVNIGDRQAGRIRGANVIEAEPSAPSISGAIERALSTGFRLSLKGSLNPYGAGEASEKILEVLKGVPLEGLVRKSFNDISQQWSAV
ncbi:MAG: UDP-N-acetyl-D-glucosamine 2-epimerase, UDP-hydrolysing [Deltaproteobacteria bacterium RIFCSPLOWO2_02_FULL_55_12]|nr:MAG: UDP-N-acetyl-D-glucosamine 2-epimerase, UDP-hydrolysing [Deltaproteobacteria bacterium RIFCSPLOWO2_02_FULL_55_12]